VVFSLAGSIYFFTFERLMAIFSKTCEYAIRAVFYIAQKSAAGKRVGIKEIASGIDSPELYLGKILQDLSRKGLISSFKGPNGGFFLEEQALKRSVSDIVEAVDGDRLFYGCALGLKQCSGDNPCPLHHQFESIRTEIHALLKNTTIGAFNEELFQGLLCLKR